MIIHDSDRALKRKWFAQKQLRACLAAGVPGKGAMIDGIKVKVWQIDDTLNGGIMISPMGLVVTCVHGTYEIDEAPTILSGRYTACVADFWMGGINHKADMNNLVVNPVGQQVVTGRFVSADLFEYLDPDYGGDPEGSGTWEIHPFKLVPSQSSKITDGFGSINPGINYQDIWNTPRSMPYRGELFWTGAGGVHWYDPDGNGYANELKWITEILLNFYSADGGQKTRTGVLQEVGSVAFVYPSRIYPGMPKFETVEQEEVEVDGVPTMVDVEKEFTRWGHMHTVDYDRTEEDNAVIGNWFELDLNEIRSSTWLLSTIVQGVPSATLRSLMNDEARPHGNYQFAIGHDGEVQQLHAMNCWYDPVPTAGVNTEFSSFFSSNPSLKGYSYPIFKWSNNGSIYHWTFTDILPLLESLADNTIETSPGVYDMQVVHHLIGQLFPFPNDNFTCAFDSVMFHDHSGNVYTWTRHYGAVRFANSGITAYTLYLPDTVTAHDGVRPDIALAAGSHYTLIATKPAKLSEPFTDTDWVGVKGVFIGTPFSPDSWLQLPDPPAGFRLRMVRPVGSEVIEEVGNPRNGELISASFLGVIEQYELLTGETSLPHYPFRACFINYAQDQETLAWSGAWQVMTPIPIADIDWHDQFDVSLFGVGKLADDLRNHPDPPNILCTMPVQPYANYAAAGFP